MNNSSFNTRDNEYYKKIHSSINKLLNTETSLKKKSKKSTEKDLNKNLFIETVVGVIEINRLYRKLSELGINAESFYQISLNSIECLIELTLGADSLHTIVEFLENVLNREDYDENGNEKDIDDVVTIQELENLWDEVSKISPFFK